MRLRGKVHHDAGLVIAEQTINQPGVTDVTTNEGMARVTLEFRQVFKVASVGELVEVDHGLAGGRYPIEYEVCTDKSGAAGDENHRSPQNGKSQLPTPTFRTNRGECVFDPWGIQEAWSQGKHDNAVINLPQ